MSYFRVIPRLDIKGSSLVKGIHLEGLRVLGSPELFAEQYYLEGADELIYQDVVASLYGINSLEKIITKTAKNIFIPLTVGGGIRNEDDINRVLRAGADKVAINTAFINEPSFINKASKMFGSSTIVASIEVIRSKDGRYLAYTDNGREYTGKDLVEWVCEVQDRGAGEIILTSIDNEGTGEGYDLNLIEKIVKGVEIPLIVHGGAGVLEDIINAAKFTNVRGVSFSSITHYSLLKKYEFSKNQNIIDGNTEFLSYKKEFKNFKNVSINDIKKSLSLNNIPVRN